MTAVAAVSAQIATVDLNETAIVNVSDNISDVTNVSTNMATVTDAAGDLSSIQTAMLQMATAFTNSQTRYVAAVAFS